MYPVDTYSWVSLSVCDACPTQPQRRGLFDVLSVESQQPNVCIRRCVPTVLWVRKHVHSRSGSVCGLSDLDVLDPRRHDGSGDVRGLPGGEVQRRKRRCACMHQLTGQYVLVGRSRRATLRLCHVSLGQILDVRHVYVDHVLWMLAGRNHARDLSCQG